MAEVQRSSKVTFLVRWEIQMSRRAGSFPSLGKAASRIREPRFLHFCILFFVGRIHLGLIVTQLKAAILAPKSFQSLYCIPVFCLLEKYSRVWHVAVSLLAEPTDGVKGVTCRVGKPTGSRSFRPYTKACLLSSREKILRFKLRQKTKNQPTNQTIRMGEWLKMGLWAHSLVTGEPCVGQRLGCKAASGRSPLVLSNNF